MAGAFECTCHLPHEYEREAACLIRQVSLFGLIMEVKNSPYAERPDTCSLAQVQVRFPYVLGHVQNEPSGRCVR